MMQIDESMESLLAVALPEVFNILCSCNGAACD